MRSDKTERVNYNYKRAARLFFYWALAVLGVAVLTLILNMVFLFAAAVVYMDTEAHYIYGESVMEALTLTKNGYVLDRGMEEELAQKEQWAMLLDENGRVVWSFRKPKELEDEYSRSDVARMSKWYLKGYPVRMRVWDDCIMIVGMQKETMWKYTVEFSKPWMEFVERTVLAFFFLNFAWIVVSAFAFTKRFMGSRERARIEWIAGISHDIRTPLSVVLGYADTLERSMALPAETRQQAAVIRHQSMVMKELIADLNLTSKLDYSMQALRKEKVRPAEIARSVAASFLNDAMPGELEIDVQIGQDAEQMHVKADRQLLVRVFRNLIHNSMKHSGKNEPLKITIVIWEEKSRCHICLKDNGVGYPEEALRRLQSRKKQAEEQIRGLEIVKKIILAHGGKIRFGNGEDGGGYCMIELRRMKKVE